MRGLTTSERGRGDMEPESTELFDVRAFAREARGSHRELLAERLGERVQLGADAARLARALQELEGATMHRMRNILVTATHKDARVTAFLTTWAYEKFWIADALGQLLAHSDAVEDLPTETGLRRHAAHEQLEHRGPIARAFLGNVAGPSITAAQLTAQLVDEWITQAAYTRLGELAADAAPVVELVLGIKASYESYFAEQVAHRLADGGKSVRLARTELLRSAWPIGALERTDDERTFFERTVFGDQLGRERASAIGTRIAALPGLDDQLGRTVASRLVP